MLTLLITVFIVLAIVLWVNREHPDEFDPPVENEPPCCGQDEGNPDEK